MDAHAIKLIRKISLKALKHISLNGASHLEIFKNENLLILLPFLNKIYDLHNSEEKMILFKAKKGKKLLNPVKALNSCLMTREICENLETRYYNKKLIDEYLSFLHHFHSTSKIE